MSESSNSGNLRFRRELPRDFNGVRSRRTLVKIRRTTPNVGFYVPTEDDVKEMLEWLHRVSNQFLQKAKNVHSPLNTYEEFYSAGLKGIAKVLHYYSGFVSASEFKKLAKTGITHRMRDVLRSLFFKKRWGFTISYQEYSDESTDSVATIASVNHSRSLRISETNLASDDTFDEVSYLELLSKARANLSPEALELFEELVSGTTFSEKERLIQRDLFEEIQKLVKRLQSLGEINSTQLQHI